MNEKFDVVGLGNALLDIQVHVSEAALSELKVQKASMQLVDSEQQRKLLSQVSNSGHPATKSSGGCAANTLAGIASFGGKVHLFAKVGSDENGKYYEEDLKACGFSFSTDPHSSLATGTCLALITPDAERTMFTHLGAAQQLSPADIQSDIIQQASLTYLEGYLWDAPLGKEACMRAAEIAKQAGKKIALTLSDAYCVDRHWEDFKNFSEEQVDILFCNESEALRLTKKNTIESAFQELQKICEYVFISVGPRGALLSADFGKETASVATWDVPLVDKIGAGDLFAAGVLYGLSQKRSLKECGFLGCYAATRVIQQLSARVSEHLKSSIDVALRGPGAQATEAISLIA